jgi:mitochondrial FAD-linked sulfhydryl oxidase
MFHAQTYPVLSEKAIAEAVKNCPLDKDQLGRNTWSFLHTMAAHYPETPSKTQQEKMKNFMHIFSEFYPCEPCAADLREQ